MWGHYVYVRGRRSAIVDLVLWRAGKHTQGLHVWIPPIEWGQALTHNTDVNVTRRGTVRLRRAPAESDHPADPNRPEQWEQATAPTRDTALRAAGLRTPDDDLPPTPTDSDHPPPEVWCTVLERGHYYVIAATAMSPGPQWLVKGTDTMLAPGAAPPGAVGDPMTPHRVLRGVLQPGDKPPARALAQITSGKAGYHLGLAMLCLTHWIQRRWPPTGTVPWIWAIPTAHTQIEAGPDTRPNPPPADRSTPSPAGTTPSTGSSAAWVLAQSWHTPFPPLTKRSTRYASSSAKSLPRQQKTASFSSKPPGLQLTTQARRGERTHTPTQHTPPHKPRPCPSPLAAHPETQTRPPSRAPPGPATRACPPSRTPAHARHRPTRWTPLTTPHTRQPALTRREEPRAPRHARPTQWPARTRPPRTPQKTQAHPPRPLNAAHANCSPPRTPTHTTSHIAGPWPSKSPEREGHSPAPPSPAAADQIGPPGRKVTTGPRQLPLVWGPPLLALHTSFRNNPLETRLPSPHRPYPS